MISVLVHSEANVTWR